MPLNSLDLVTVIETDDSLAFGLAKASLEDADIEYLVTGDPRSIGGFPGNFAVGQTPLGTKGPWSIQVARESEIEARAVLEPLQKRVAAPKSQTDRNAH